MAQMPNLKSTNTLGDSDEVLVRQGTVDKRIRLSLANLLSWSKRSGYTYLGTHTTGIEFTNLNSFTEYNGKAYFVKEDTVLPYTTTSSDPQTEGSLRSGTEVNQYREWERLKYASEDNYKSDWGVATGQSLIPASYSHNDKLWQQLQDITDITLQEPQENLYWTELYISSGSQNTVESVEDMLPLKVKVGDYIQVVSASLNEKYNVSETVPDNALSAYYQLDNGLYANKVEEITGTAGLLNEDEIIRGKVSGGNFSWWNEPQAVSRFERGQKISYVGWVRGTTGEQGVTRINLDTGERSDKVVLDKFGADDHNSCAVNFTPGGKIVIACTGHNDTATGNPSTGGEYLHFDVFNTWNDVGTLTQTKAFPATLSYAQIFVVYHRIYIVTRRDNRFWDYMLSDDFGKTWIGQGDNFNGSPFLVNMFSANEQVYAMGRHVDRKEGLDYVAGTVDEQVRFGITYNASTGSDNELRTLALRYDANTRTHSLRVGTTDHVIGGGGRPITECNTLYTPEVGKRIRLLDMNGAEASGDIQALVIETNDDSPTFSNPLCKIVTTSTNSTVTVPLPVGEALPWPMYYPGACFVRQPNPDYSAERVELYMASNDGVDGIYSIYRCVLKGGRWQIALTQKLPAATGRIGRLCGVEGGLGKMAASLFTKYGPSNPQYKDFDGTFEIISNTSTIPEKAQYFEDLGSDGRWIFQRDGTVDIYGTVPASGSLTGTIDLNVHLQNILHISYDDNSSGGGQKISTVGEYNSYNQPIRSVDWGSDVDAASFSYHIKGVSLWQSGFPAFA